MIFHRFQKLINNLGQEIALSSGDKVHIIFFCFVFQLNLLLLHQLSNQKRQILKDKFKGFNTELEEQHRIQKDWSIPDSVLKRRVRIDNVELIVPLYTAFYNT